ncbi:MAG: glycosyltransferase family 4 protein [Alphaproteobacteria bacterium]|nr:glycosyltransferase family 4 protein [Alphaproteobacteria bacterium]MBV9860776.1 glycosyltransferase family 4 protein [Alphaproteobacteria bacterium]
MLDRIVIINDDGAQSGGAAAVAIASARLLAGRGIPVTFVSGEGSADPELSIPGIDLVRLDGAHIMSGARGSAALRGLYNPGTRGAVCNWIKTRDTPGTVYHLHNWHKVLSPAIFGALGEVAPRLVMTAHDYFLACPNGGYFLYPRGVECEVVPGSIRCLATSCDRRHYGHKLWRFARHQLRRSLFEFSGTEATLLAVHEGMVPYLRRAGIPSRVIRTLRNPVTPWRAERVQAERNTDIFFIGRLEKDKGVDLLARAARQAGVRLRVIGEGPLALVLAEQHPEIDLLGWRPRVEIAALVAEARLVVVPTRWRETFGLVAIEALMSGIPVIASQTGLISGEIVAQGFGLACDPYDESALAGAIRQLARDDELVRLMSHRAFAGARQLAPTPEAWCDELIALYEGKLRVLAFGAEAASAGREPTVSTNHIATRPGTW